jgi:hypothetical protein
LALSSTIHSYPTQAEARQIGDAYMRTKLTPTVKKVLPSGWNGGDEKSVRSKA